MVQLRLEFTARDEYLTDLPDFMQSVQAFAAVCINKTPEHNSTKYSLHRTNILQPGLSVTEMFIYLSVHK